MARLRRYLLAGVVALAPMLVVVVLVRWLIGLSDRAILLLPEPYRPDVLLGMHLPGLGLLLAVVVILLVGALASHFVGDYLLRLIDRVMDRIPLVRSLYSAVKQLLEAMFSDSSRAFQEVVMVPFPGPGSRVVGFVTGSAPDSEGDGVRRVSVFVPSTPVPTTGWLLFVDERELVHLDISVEEGMKLVLSGGALPLPGRSGGTPD